MTDSEIYAPSHKYKENAGQFTAYDPGTRPLPAGFRFSKRYTPLTEPLVFEKDTPIQLRDGTTIYTDVFRPVGDGPFPVVVGWSPYGKTSGTSKLYTMMRWMVGVDQSKLSGLMKWEAVDPMRWCPRGTPSRIPTRVARAALKATSSSSATKKAVIAMT